MAEVTNKPEKKIEDEKLEEKMTVKEKVRKEWQLGVKILELILCALCLGLTIEPAKRTTDLIRIQLSHFALILPTFSGYILIISVFLVAKAIGDKIPYRTGFILAVLASCLFFVSGILLAVDRKEYYLRNSLSYDPKPYILKLLAASAAFSFIGSILFGAEAIFIWKFRNDF